MADRIARVRLPDGRIARVKVPEGTTPEQAMDFARQQAEEHDAKPTSFWQGVGEGAVRIARRGSDFLDSINPVNAIAKATGLTSDKQTQTIRQATDRAYATSPNRGSAAGKITGEIVASLPAMFLPGGAVVQGAAGGALMGRGRDLKSVATDAAIGAVTGKVADVGLRAVGRAVRPLARKAAEPVSAVARRLGVRPTPATVGGGTAGTVQRMLGNVPGAGSVVAKGVGQETDDLANAARGVAANLGPVRTPQAAGEAVARGAQVFKRATGAKANTLYRARDNLMGGTDAPVIMGSASKALDDFASEFPMTPALNSIMEHPAVRKIASALPDRPNPEITLSEATAALSHIRSAVRNAERSNTITGQVRGRIKIFEQAIEDDIMRAAGAADAIAGRTGLPGGAAATQRSADAFYAGRARTLGGALKAPLASAQDDVAKSGEAVFKQVTGDMLEGGNIARLRETWRALPTYQRRTVAATAFDQLGKAKPGATTAVPGSVAEDGAQEAAEWSFNTFLTNYGKMSPEARKLVFGGRGVDQQIDDIARYSARLREVDKNRNFSNTANLAIQSSLAGAYMLAVGGQLWEGDLEGAGKAAVTLPAAALAAKGFMATPAGRLWLRNSLKALAEKGGTPAGEATLRKLTRQLPVIAESNPVIREEALGLFRTLTNAVDQSPGRVTAAGQQENDARREPPQ